MKKPQMTANKVHKEKQPDRKLSMKKKRKLQQTRNDGWISCWKFCVILTWLNVDQREAQFKSVSGKRANVVIWRQNRQARSRQKHDFMILYLAPTTQQL